LIFGGAAQSASVPSNRTAQRLSYQTRSSARMRACWRSEYLRKSQFRVARGVAFARRATSRKRT
jgi:hypothetical protein